MTCDDSFYGAKSDRIDRLVARALDDLDAEEPIGPPTSLEMVLEQPGSHIDRYKLLRVLGKGGMGIVYLAEQQKPVRREVALKIIKPGMDSKRVLARFEAEQQALAMMEHPHIARVYDAGLAPSGRPYFVMEHVSGIAITDHCDTYKLTIDERLHLFLHVCEAVQHAHQKGIIHRDLKPSNILVVIQDEETVPKVIDFGVARATSQSPTEGTLYTEQGQLIGTPEYMSPEQANPANHDIDTRADVYALGVVLYELLAGRLPFDAQTFRTGGIEHIRKVICEEEPKTPSTWLSKTPAEESAELARRRQTDVRTLRCKLHGDLDWITLKAMERDRTRRYATVDALATDIRNHLHQQPVSAAPPGALYQAGKFARRHRQAMAVVGAVVMLLLVLLWAARAHVHAGRERTHAEALGHDRILGLAWRLFETGGMQAQGVSDPSGKALAMIEPLLVSRYVGPEARLLFANILVEHRHYDEAVSKLKDLCRLNDQPEIAGAAHALLARTIWENSSLGTEELRKVDEHRQKAEQLLPRTAEAYYLRAMTALTIPEKLDLLADALRLDPRHYESRRLRALTYHASRKYGRLNEDALAMTLLRPQDPLGYSLRAAASRELGDYDTAVEYYDIAVGLTPRDDPQFIELNGRRCEVLMRMGRYERVLADAEEYLQDVPNATVLHSHVFCALTALGRYEQASALFRRIADSDVAAATRLRDCSMKHVFDTLEAGSVWHPPDSRPEGPAFLYMLEAEQMHRELSAKARRLFTNCFAGRWSPDGTKVAFSLGLPGNSGVAIYDPATKETDLPIVPGKDPSWSPDGRHIAFVRDSEALRLSELTTGERRIHNHAYFMGEEVWVMQADGTRPRRLARGAGFPSWSADAKHVYYHSRIDHMLYSISIEDTQAPPMAVFACSSYYPALSPDGNRLAHVGAASDWGWVRNGTLKITDMASQSCIAELPAPLKMWGGDWSPDGREFSFGGTNAVQEPTGLWIYDLDRGQAARVLNGQILEATWSPDKAQLLIRLGAPYWELWVADLDPTVSTVEALGPARTLEEHCRECIEACNRHLEVDPNLLIKHLARTASALWIAHDQAPVYVQELDSAAGRGPPQAFAYYANAKWILTHPALYDRLSPLALVLARRAAGVSAYARDLAHMLYHLGQQEQAIHLWQMAEAPVLAGSCRYDKSSDTYTVLGCGADIWYTADDFHFVAKVLKGDGSITARIESIENVHEWTKAGVMIRESLDPGAKFGAVYATAGKGVHYQSRRATNDDALSDTEMSTPEQSELHFPVWVKIERNADRFSGFYSADGVTWIPMVWNAKIISMPDNVYIGLAVTSHDVTRTAEARIAQVATTGSVSPPGPFTDSHDICLQIPASPDHADDR